MNIYILLLILIGLMSGCVDTPVIITNNITTTSSVLCPTLNHNLTIQQLREADNITKQKFIDDKCVFHQVLIVSQELK